MAQTTKIALIAGLATLLAASIRAQLRSVGPRARPLPQLGRADRHRSRFLFDQVIGVIGDKAILGSSVRNELDTWIKQRQAAGHPPSDEEIAHYSRFILGNIQQKEALAQAARSLPESTRDKMDSLVNQWIQEEQRREEERAGSVNKLRDQLGILGQTLDSQVEERKTERLAALAWQQSMQARWRDNVQLAITPRAMKRYYDENIGKFVQDPSVDLAVIGIFGDDDPAASFDRANRCAAAWRADGDRSAEELAREFGGRALSPRLNVRDAESDQHQARIKQFAGSAKAGEVSEPIPMGSGFWILRVTQRRDGANRSFSDPEVQQEILQDLVQLLLETEHNKLVFKSRKRFELVRPQRRPR